MVLTDLYTMPHLHHAYAVRGDSVAPVEALLAARGVQVLGNPDVFSATYTDFTIDDARSVQKFASYSALGAHKYVLLQFATINIAAQNALLKTLEEAPGSTLFFLITPGVGKLLPTIRSRIMMVGSGAAIEAATVPLAKKFLALEPSERLLLLEKMLAAAQKSDDKAPLMRLTTDLVVAAHAAGAPPGTLRQLLTAHQHVHQQGTSLKLVLMNLAVTV